MKRFLCLVCCAVLLASMAVPVRADDGYDELRQQIITSMETSQRLDVSAYGLDQDELMAIYEDLFHRGLLPWYADYYFDWTASPDGTVSVMIPRDLRTRSYDEDLYERSMAELIAETCHEGMTPVQMVLSVHDYIVARDHYHFGTSTNNGYHALVKGQTACYGYSQLFLRVMTRLGIPCRIVTCDDTGEGVGHAWNVVQLDGNWYHIDLTWDDPVPDAQGRALHEHFLKTDAEFMDENNGHDFGWESDVECRDETFTSDTLWDDITSPIVFPNGETMFLRQDDEDTVRIYTYDLQTGETTLLHRMRQDPVQMGKFYYYCQSMGLNFWNERLWFNTPDTVYSMNIDGTDLKTEYTYDTAENDKFIYSFLADDGVLSLSLVDISGEVTEQQVKLEGVAYHVHSYESVWVDATCTQEGYRQNTCPCGVTYHTDQTDPLDHELALEALEGRVRHYCLNCGYGWEETVTTTEPMPTEPALTQSPEVSAEEMSLPIPAFLGAAVIAAGVLLLRSSRKKRRT